MKNTPFLLQQLEDMFLSEEPTHPLPAEAQDVLHSLKEYIKVREKHIKALQRSNKQIRQAQSYYQALFKAAPVSIITLSKQGQLLSFNNEASDMLSVAEHQSGIPFKTFLDADSRKTFKQHLRKIFVSKTLQRCELKISFQTFDGQQHEHDIMLDSIWITNKAAPSSGYSLSVCNNISGFKKLQSDLEDGRIQAEKASSMKSQFLANMSHEIRTPLSSILGYVDLLRQDIQEQEQKDKLEIVYRASKHLLYLINEVIDLSRIEHGGFTLRSAPFSLSAMLNDLQNLFEIAAEKQSIQLLFTRGFLQEPLVGDATRIRQILMNVIGNAIKFTPAGGQVKVHVFYQQEHLIIRVQDTGPGIEKEQREVIFEMFHQADNSDTRTHGGSGLGLAISRKLAEMMNGTIHIESEFKKGSTFTIRIPLEIADDGEDFNESSGILPVPFFSASMEQAPRILIVDDDRVLQRLLGIFIERMGYEYAIAVHGQDALEILQKETFDLILLDLQMPVMDGYETIQQIRKREEWRCIPVIALTAKAIQDDLDKCLTLGCDTYLTKPIIYKQLAQQIHQYLRPIDDEQTEIRG